MTTNTAIRVSRLLHHAQWTLRDLQSKCESITRKSAYARELFREEDDRLIAQRLRELEVELVRLEAAMTESQP